MKEEKVLGLEKQMTIIRLEQKEAIRKYEEAEESKSQVSLCEGKEYLHQCNMVIVKTQLLYIHTILCPNNNHITVQYVIY